MPARSTDVTLTFPSSSVDDLVALSTDLLDRMRALLDRNTDGDRSPIEMVELETLTRMAQFSQLLSSAMQSTALP